MTQTLPRTIDASVVREQGGSVRLLDVRTRSEFANGHIEGSHNVPLPDLGRYAAQLAGVGGDLVVVCRSGQRAAQAVELLQGHGATNAQVLDGGILGWQASGGQVVETGKGWELERQVRLVAGSIVLTSILASIKAPKARFVAGGIGAGLTFAAVSNTCMMGNVLSRLPYNRVRTEDTDAAVRKLAG